VVITNDDTLSAEDVALGDKGAWIIKACFRRMKQKELEVRPMFRWAPRRIEAHVKLCVLALQVQRAAELRYGEPWSRIAPVLGRLKAVRYRTESRIIVQRTKIDAELGEILKTLRISTPKQILAMDDPALPPQPHRHTPRIRPRQAVVPNGKISASAYRPRTRAGPYPAGAGYPGGDPPGAAGEGRAVGGVDAGDAEGVGRAVAALLLPALT
jgi:hypothetical protein